MMTPEEVQAHAAAIQGNGYAPPTPPASIAAPVDAPVAPPVADSQMPPASFAAPVQDGSQEPMQVTQAVPGQRVQTASAFNVRDASPSAQDVAQHGDAYADATLKDLETANKTQTQANKDLGDANAQVAEAQAPILADKADMDGYLAQEAHNDMVEAEDNSKKHFNVLMNYNKEIQDHVANQPTDLWGRAGVNKVAGVIGLVLGGLGGGSTGGKNMVVDTLNALVDQNLKQNEYKYEMLKGKVSTENQAYAQIMQTSKNKAEAADRYRLLANESAMSMLNQAAGQFAGPKAKALAEQQTAQLQMQNVEIKQKLFGDINASYRTAGELASQKRQQDLQSVQLQAEDKGRKDKEKDEQSVAYWEPSDKTHMTSGDASKLREQQGSAAQVQDILGEMIVDAQKGGIQAVLNNKQGQANLQIGLIGQKALSKRVTEAEAKAMSAMTGFLATGNQAALLTLMGAKTVPEALFKAKQQFAQQHVTNLAVGYGLKPTEDNPFVSAANAKYEYNQEEDVGGPKDGSDPVSATKSRNEIAQEAARSAQVKMHPPGYAAY